MSERCMIKLQGRGLLKGLKACHLKFCKYCVLDMQTKVQFLSLVSHNNSSVLGYVHIDLWGAASLKSNGCVVYFITFIDEFFKKVWVYSMKHKDKIFSMFKQ